MADQQAMDLLAAAEQALASIQLPPVGESLPSGAQVVRWEEFGGEATGRTKVGELSQNEETLDLQIELGRTRIHQEEIEKLRTGAVVQLDNPAAMPVDLLVDGRVVARGEVLTIEGKLGVRVLEVIPHAVTH